MAMIEDLSVFFSEYEFADRAAWIPANIALGLPVAGTVIYDQNGTILGDYGVSTEGPACVYPSVQWPHAAEGDRLEIIFSPATLSPPRSRMYRIRSIQALDDGAISLATLARE